MRMLLAKIALMFVFASSIFLMAYVGYVHATPQPEKPYELSNYQDDKWVSLCKISHELDEQPKTEQEINTLCEVEVQRLKIKFEGE